MTNSSIRQNVGGDFAEDAVSHPDLRFLPDATRRAVRRPIATASPTPPGLAFDLASTCTPASTSPSQTLVRETGRRRGRRGRRQSGRGHLQLGGCNRVQQSDQGREQHPATSMTAVSAAEGWASNFPQPPKRSAGSSATTPRASSSLSRSASRAARRPGPRAGRAPR